MENIILTTMCAILDEEKNRALFINRKKDWKGIAFPGGHLEPNESITDCIIREIKEETNLNIYNIEFKGIINFYNPDTNERHIVFNFSTKTFFGELHKHCNEGELMWVNYSDIKSLEFAEGMELRMDLFFGNSVVEMFVEWNEKDGYKRTVRNCYGEKL